ncbi:MAG: epimerase [Rubellimicrobium sp.]|nr:epimerase [Rubellimicrobium sp.]
MTGTVLILGPSGKIGSHSARAFADAGWTVRPYRRGSDMTAAARGADVIVNGLNPSGYHDWARQIPAITTQVIAAAKAGGATVIIPGNIYNFGLAPGALTEDTPHRPNTRKGRIRVEMEEAYRASGVPTIILRAGNFIDPEGNGDIMSALIMRDLRKGHLSDAGDRTALQAYAYVPDWARAAVMLAERRESLARFEDVPFPGHAFTLVDLQEAVTDAVGRRVTIRPFPWWAIRLASPVWEMARELLEMRYLWSMPHRIGAAKFDRLLPEFEPTELRKVMLAGASVALGQDKIDPDQPVRTGALSILAD